MLRPVTVPVTRVYIKKVKRKTRGFCLTEGSKFFEVLFCDMPRELSFADQGQSAKIKTRKNFMLHAISAHHHAISYQGKINHLHG